jgi:hypothetical protein
MSKLSRETEALLERGRAGTPLTPAHRARLRGAILARAAGAAVVTSAASAAAWTSLGTKIGGALGLVVAVGAAGVALGSRVPNRSSPSPATVAATSGAGDRAPHATAGSYPQVPTAISNAMPTATTPRGPLTIPSSASIPASTSVRASTPAPIWRETSKPVPAATSTDALPPPVGLPASTVSSLERDVRLLRDADLATKAGDPERALALLDEHALTFPRSDLEPERFAERVFALCRARRIDEARSAASAFLHAHPTGPLAVRVRATCRGGAAE